VLTGIRRVMNVHYVSGKQEHQQTCQIECKLDSADKSMLPTGLYIKYYKEFATAKLGDKL
jgi:hypothetical protein